MGKSVSKRKAVAAPAAGDEESARGRLLSAATHLFCKNGINATASMPSSMKPAPPRPRSTNCSDRRPTWSTPCWESEGKAWREWFIGAMEDGGGGAQAKADAGFFPALKRWFAEERFYGCPFINALAEHDKDAKQFRNIALRHKKVVLAHIEKLAR